MDFGVERRERFALQKGLSICSTLLVVLGCAYIWEKPHTHTLTDLGA